MWTAGEIAMQALPSGVTLAPTASMALDRLSTHNSCGCTNTARPCNQLHKTTPQAIHGFRKKFYWCPVAPTNRKRTPNAGFRVPSCVGKSGS